MEAKCKREGAVESGHIVTPEEAQKFVEGLTPFQRQGIAALILKSIERGVQSGKLPSPRPEDTAKGA